MAEKTMTTPGPWSALFNNHYWQIDCEEHGQIGDACASMFIDGTSENPNFVLAEANARLMAAAPELLQLAFQYRDDLHHPPSEDSLERRIAAIKTVIAKATGGEA